MDSPTYPQANAPPVVRTRRFVKGLRTVAGFVLLTLLMPMVAEFGVKLAEEQGAYTRPTDKVRTAAAMLTALVSDPLYQFTVVGAVCFALGVWFDVVARRLDRRRADPVAAAVRSRSGASRPSSKVSATASDERQSPQASRPEPPKRIFVPEGITPKILVSFFEGHTGIEAEKLLAPYIGNWIKVTGLVKDISPEAFDRLAISFEWNRPDPIVHAYFLGEEKQQVMMLRRGTPVTVIGRINHVTNTGVSLEPCEIVG